MFQKILITVILSIVASIANAETPYVILQYSTAIQVDFFSPSSGDDTHKIASGETIYGIMRHYFGPGEDIDTLIDQTVKANPSAFLDGDANRMLAGQILTLPTFDNGPEVADAIFQF